MSRWRSGESTHLHAKGQGSCFFFVVDLVLRRTVEPAGTGIRWKITPTLQDLDCADDLALISSTFTHIQMKVDHLNRNGKETGLKTRERLL